MKIHNIGFRKLIIQIEETIEDEQEAKLNKRLEELFPRYKIMIMSGVK